ncbi:MAG TPA: hypothetical protein VIA81_02705 [Acidimicrobiia bacterium]|jgi:hypothetical protein
MEGKTSADLTGTVRMAGDHEAGIRVEIHLDEEELRLVSGYGELGRWPIDEVGVAANLDGFHLRIQGEELIVSTSDDARFALALGIRSSNSPRLNRLLANARDAGLDTGDVLAPAPPMPITDDFERTEEQPQTTTSVAMGVLAAGALQFLGGLIPLATDSTVKIASLVPVWPFWVVAALAMVIGGFALLTGFRQGNKLVAVGVLIGLITATGTLLEASQPGFSLITDGVVLGGAGTILAGLLLSIDMLNRSR